MENRPEWPLSYFGLLLAGGTAVPVDLQSRPEHLAYVLEQTRAKVVLASAKAPLVEIAQAPSVQHLVVLGEPPACLTQTVDFGALLKSPPATDLPDIHLDDLASIIYTSGTTGPPKGVMLTQKNFAANYRGIAALEAVTPKDNFLAILPLFHAFPFTATLILPLFSGATVTFIDTLKAEPVLRCLKEQQVTILPVTPQVLQHFYRGIAKKLEDLPLGLGKALNWALDLSRRWREGGGPDLTGPLTRKFQQSPGGTIPLLCQRWGQAARGGGGEFCQTGVYGAGRLRPHRNRARGRYEPAPGPPVRRGRQTPGRGGSED